MKSIRLIATAVLAAGCSNAGSDLGVGPMVSRNVLIQVILDRDGSGTQTAIDTAYGGARLSLRPVSGGQAIQTVTSNPSGDAEFRNIPVGEYSLTVDPASLGDSLVPGPSDPVRVTVSATTISVLVQVVYRQRFLREVRSLPIGQRVLVRGLILAGVQSFRDTTSHIADSSGQIRLTRVSLRGGLTGNNPGDSVVVVGTVSSRAGQPTLDLAVITLVGTRPAPIPISVTTAQAANASAGVLDAALVQISGAIIADTGSVGPDYRVVGNDGSGPVTVILDAFGGFNRNDFRLGRSMTVRGVLVPTGTGEWQLKPRNAGDAAVF